MYAFKNDINSILGTKIHATSVELDVTESNGQTCKLPADQNSDQIPSHLKPIISSFYTVSTVIYYITVIHVCMYICSKCEQ